MDKLVREFAEELKNNDLENTFRRRLARQYRRMARRTPDPVERARLYRYSFDHVPRVHVARRYLMARLRAWYSAPRTKQPVNAEAG